jgi:hypothetical protein
VAYNGSGVHNRVMNWATDLAGGIPVTAARMDQEHDDISTALDLVMCRDGQSTTTARIPFAAGTSAAAGTTASVAYSQTNDNNTGLYFPATDQWGLVAGGVATITSTATKVTLPVAVDFTGAAAPTSDDGAALGATGQKWSDLFLASGAVINWNSGNATQTHSAGTLTTAVTTFAITGALTVSTTAAITGNATFAGTVAVTGTLAAGATTVTGALAASGDFAIATNKFTVASASGNAAVAGTLAVTGATTATGAVTANNAAGITGRNTVKAFGKVVNGTLQAGSFNVASVTDNGTEHTVAFTSAMGNANYGVVLTIDSSNADQAVIITYQDAVAASFDVHAFISGVGGVDPDSYSFMVLSNE